MSTNQHTSRRAMTTLEFLRQDKEARMRYEMRRKALLDHYSMIEGAREEGRAEGIAQGIAQGMAQGMAKGQRNKALEVAKNMLLKGMDAGLIAEVTGLSLEEIEKLR